MPSYPVRGRNKNIIHGFDFANPPTNGPLATLCGFNSDYLRTERKGMNCPRCWEEWKARKESAKISKEA